VDIRRVLEEDAEEALAKSIQKSLRSRHAGIT